MSDARGWDTAGELVTPLLSRGGLHLSLSSKNVETLADAGIGYIIPAPRLLE